MIDKKKKVLVLADFLFPEVLGGSARFASDLNDCLAEYAEIEVITRKSKGVYAGNEIVERSYIVNDFGFFRLIRYILKGCVKPDLVISHHYLLGLFSLFFGLNARKVYFFHGPVGDEESAKGGSKMLSSVKRVLQYIVLSGQGTIYCLSEYMAARVPKKFQDKLVVVGPLNKLVDKLSHDEFRLPNLHQNEFIRLLCVRRLTPRTGVLELVDLVSELADKVELTVVGSGELLKALKSKQVANVHVLSGVSEFELERIYIESDLTVLPTRELEGFGLVIVESLMRGTPVLVSSEAGGGRDFLENIAPEFVYDLNCTSEGFYVSMVRCISAFSNESTRNRIYKILQLYSIRRFARSLVESMG